MNKTISDTPINLELSSAARARVMAQHKNCPIDLEGLDSFQRALVMVCRKDCPLDLEGLDSWDRAWVLRERGQEESA